LIGSAIGFIRLFADRYHGAPAKEKQQHHERADDYVKDNLLAAVHFRKFFASNAG
jgi:hypothetical protein